MARILIIRFSALGDVAMTIPVIHSLAVQYPQHEITVLSRGVWQPLFQSLPENVNFVGADLTGKHKGLWGLNSLYSELKRMHFDYVADFHHVLRSKYLCLRFRLANIPVAFICKGRAGKKKLVRRRHKVLENQKSSFRRYADVLEKLGLPVLLNFSSIYGEGKGDFAEIEPMTGPKGKQKWIGIAPFAKHKGKIYPLELQEQVVAHFAYSFRTDRRQRILLYRLKVLIIRFMLVCMFRLLRALYMAEKERLPETALLKTLSIMLPVQLLYARMKDSRMLSWMICTILEAYGSVTYCT